MRSTERNGGSVVTGSAQSQSGLIAKDTITQIHDRADIVQEIGLRVPLKKAGTSFVGLCPFHGEKSPSFHVSAVRQRYHCFGCGADGDLIEFLMQHDGMEFNEVIDDLAGKLGVRIDRQGASNALPGSPGAGSSRHEYDVLTEICQRAQQHYRQQLGRSPSALSYVQARGLTQEVLETYGIGYASANADGLRQLYGDYDGHAGLVQAGLVACVQDGEHQGRRYDRFRDRLMFPIRDTKGRVIGFGGRIIHNGNTKAAKYLNSPETPIFSKHKVLYGLHEARASIMRAKEVYVTEGYMDVVGMAMHGITNAVAAMGTALTQDHVRHLLRFSRNICFVFDGDDAGQNAASKSARTVLALLQPGVNIRFITLPDQQDPDEYLQAHGRAAFISLVNTQAKSLSEFLLAKLLATHGRDGKLVTLEAKANFAREGRELIEQIPAENQLRQLFRQEIEMMTDVRSGGHWQGRLSASEGAAPDRAVAPRRRWLPDDEYRVQQAALRRPGAAPPMLNAHLRRPWTGGPDAFKLEITTAPAKPNKSLWQRLVQAIRTAPQQAFALSVQIAPLLDPQDPQELEVLLALDALDRAEQFEANQGIAPDDMQAAIDILGSAVSLIAKNRRQMRLEHLRALREAGEMSDERYVVEASALPKK